MGEGFRWTLTGNAYVTGYSPATWGAPRRAYSGNGDAFVAKLNANGVLLWNTFLGSSGFDGGWAIAVDDWGNSFVTGDSRASWGDPHRSYSGGYEAFVAKLNDDGDLEWNTFLGSSQNDYGQTSAWPAVTSWW